MGSVERGDIERLEQLVQDQAPELQDLVASLRNHCNSLRNQNARLRQIIDHLDMERGRYSDLYDLSPIGYIILDANLVVKEGNVAAANLLGTSKEGLIGKSLVSFISPDSIDIFSFHYRVVREEELLQVDTIKAIPRKGREMYLQFNSLPVDHPVRQIRTSLVDITESVKANYLNSALNNINMVIYSSMTVDEMLQRVIREATLSIGMEAGVILFKDAGQWIITHGFNIPERWHRLAVQAPFAKIAEDISSNLVPFSSPDAFNDSHIDAILAREARVRSVIVFPLREGTQGLIAFFQRSLPIDIDGPMIDFAGNLSSSISLAIAKNEALEAEREERYLLKTALDNAPAAIVVLDGRDLSIKWSNEYSKRYRFGPYTDVDTNGLSIDEILSDIRLADIVKLFRHVAESGETYFAEEMEVTGLGSKTMYWKGALVPMWVRNRTSSDVMVLAVDVTDQVLARKRIEELASQADSERRRLRTIIDTLPVGVVISDGQGNILESNSMRDEIWGEDQSQVKHIDEWWRYKGWWAANGHQLRPDDWPIIKALKGELNSGSIIDVERPDRLRRTLIVSAGPFRDANGEIIGAVSITQDITEQKNLEREAVEAKERAELYVDLLTHDINNMNAGAMGYLQLLEERMDLGEKERRWVQKSLETLEDSTRLIDNVQKIQKLGSKGLKKERVDIGAMLSEITEQRNNPPGKEVVIDFKPTEGQEVVANELLRDVFTNVIGNAIKHSSGPVRIGIRLEATEKDGLPYHRVIVEDNGPGISDQMKERLFVRPQKGGKRAGGRGLGLYLVGRLVENFGGQARVEDRVPGNQSQGARFIIDLPAAS